MRAAPTQDQLWPFRFFGLGRYAPAQILRTAARLTGRKLRAGEFEGPARVRRPRPAAIDPVAAILTGCAELVRLIGRPELRETPEAAAWLAIDRAGPIPAARIHYRGPLVDGVRQFSFEALDGAMRAGRDALRAAGIALGLYAQVLRRPGGGAVATISLRLPTRARGPAILGA